MTGTTISHSYVNGVGLANAAVYNPVTILAGVTISNAGGPALQASGTTVDWIIANAGSVVSTGATTGSYGIALQGGGTITNQAGGVVGGGYGGVAMFAIGTVVNQGSIVATNPTAGDGIVLVGGGAVANGAGGSISGGEHGIVLDVAGTIANSGAVQGATGDGALLSGGGTVTNNTTSSIVGFKTGVSLVGAGTVVNQGSIGASRTTGGGYTSSNTTHLTTLFDAGVLMGSGGVSNAASGTISDYFFGIAADGVASVVNQGLITASSTTIGLGIFMLGGGTVSNASSGTIAGQFDALLIAGTAAGTAINQGQISAGHRAGFDFFGAASYGSNAASGTIAGYIGVLLRGTGTVVNAGSIGGTQYGIDMAGAGTVTNAAYAAISAHVGVLELAGGTVSNQGTIAADGIAAKGVYLYAAGYVRNGGTIRSSGTSTVVTHGTVTKTLGVAGVYVDNGAGTVVNFGSISSAETGDGAGIKMTSGGTVTNAAGASVTGQFIGVQIYGTGTVRNQGTIIGNSGTAVSFDGTNNLLVLSPGAVVSGVVDAPIIPTNTLELASASGTGTLTGPGRFFTKLDAMTVDNGASWNLAGSTLLDGGGLVNGGQITLDPSTLLVANLTGTGSVIIDSGSTLIVQGSVSTGETIVFNGTNAELDLGNPAGMAGTISGYVGGNATYDGPRTVTNTGTIAGTSGYGVVIGTGGLVTNAASASISGKYTGVFMSGGTAQVVNAGSVGGTRYGINLETPGTVTNAVSASISATVGVFELVAGGTIQNQGTIVGVGGQARGISLYAAGYAGNAATGTISSGSVGVLVANGAGTVTNFGSITSSERLAGAGVELKAGGTVTNAAGATISTQLFGVQIYGSGTVVNRGSIVANDSIKGYGAGVWIKGPAEITNASSGTISGGLFAVVLYNQSTVTNAGAILGTATAVSATPGFANRIIVEPGATFSGVVSGGNALTSTIASVLELGAGSIAGTIAGFGSKYIDFQQITLDTGASWSLGGTIAAAQTVAFGGPGTTLTLANPGSMAGVIDGFSAHDMIVLTGVTGVTAATLEAGNLLTVVPGSGPNLTLQLDPTQTFSSTNFNFFASGGNTDLTVPCFAAGTRIATPSGEVAVERLRVGDVVLTRRGARRVVAWLGHRRIDCRRHPRPREVWPVRVRTGAFGVGAPHRDLLLSPDHAVFISDVLIPIRYLINDATIVQEPVENVFYWHVELDRHEVILAEGLCCESYLDTGNRGAFANGGGEVQMHADFARKVWRVSGCAPLVLHGAELAAARRDLLERAGTLGYAMTSDAALRLLVDGHELNGHDDRFRLPAGARRVRLVSRAAVPAHLRADSNDYRRLGVAVSRILLDGKPIALTDPRLGAGWHDPEGEWCWTDGDAGLEISGARELRIKIVMTGRYWLPRNEAAITSRRSAALPPGRA